jgi:hypothetical protein
MLVCILIVAVHGIASAQKLPVIDGKKTIATVNYEPITLQEFNSAIAASHADRPGKKKAGSIVYSGILERMINKRLIVLEARNMGLDELPEITNTVKKYSQETLMQSLLMQYVKDIKADDDEVERLYKDAVKEWKMKTVMFAKEADAKKIEAEIKGGADFDAIMKKAVAEGIAEGGEEEYLKDKELTPAIARLVSKIEVGSISPIVSVPKKGFIIFKLEGMHYPEKEDPEAMKRARLIALNQKRVQAAKGYYSDLKQRYAKINQKLLDSLDYESKEPGFDKLLQDKRVVVEIAGEDPITVEELSKALKKKFYHGVTRAVERKKINKKKIEVLESMLEKRVLLKEALAQGIDKTESYKNRVKEYENSVIFGTFIKKAVEPEIKLKTKELKTYYKENSEKYMSPTMMRIKSLVFDKRNDAAEALDKLTKGTDFNWLSSHADGQVDKTKKGLLKFEGTVLILSSLPEGVQKVVSGAKPGDFRLYESPDTHFYVLYIYHVVAPSLRPYEDVKSKIAKNIYEDKLNKEVGVWAAKLKEYYPVTIYRKDLRK